MSRDLGPVCRKCRREGVKLTLKGTRCATAKCPMEKATRNAPPGAGRTMRRGQASEYGKRLRETQKVKRYYGLLDKQFRRYFAKAQRSRANTGELLLSLLERRLDNVVYKLGFAPSRRAARLAIGHNHFTVNERRVNRPGYLVKVGDRVKARAKESSMKMARGQLEELGSPPSRAWLTVDAKELEGTVLALPARADIEIPVEENLVVEFCGR